jgi:hypothetical protein
MVPNINNEDEWDSSWLKASECLYNAGDIFIMKVGGSSPFTGVYKAVKSWHDDDDRINLEKMLPNGDWEPDHEWDLFYGTTTVKFWLGSSFGALPKINSITPEVYDICHWQAWAHNKSGDCPCGIVRIDCSYHR